MSLPPTADRKRWTADEARALQDESRAWPRFECVDTELLVSSSPRPAHDDTQMELYELVRSYTAAQHVGRVDVLDQTPVWHPEGAAEPFVLDLPAYFTDALGEEDAPDAG